MNLLYLDESGSADGWKVQDHFVLAGVAVHEGQIYGLTREIDAVQTKYFPSISIPVEFHATEIRRGKNRFKDFNPSRREEILTDMYNVICNATYPNLVAFATAIHISAVENPMQARRIILEDICQRFNRFLTRKFKTGLPSKGLLIIDRNREEEYRQCISEFQSSGTKYGYIDNIVDIPYFARCHETRMLQLADFCANAVFRYYESDESKYLDMILPRFDKRSKEGPLDGLKHITKEECECYACHWR